MLDSIKVAAVIPATPSRIYSGWLNSAAHSAFTGGEATVDPRVGGRFTAWDGYIEGTTLELEPERRILQAWRTTEFPTDSGDSRLEVLLEPVDGGTLMTILHTDIPQGQGARYEQGWRDFYITPMLAFFGEE